MAIENVLIARGAFADMYEPSWQRALIESGVKCSLFDSHNLTLPGILGRIERRSLLGPGIARIRRGLLALVDQLQPDVTLLYQGHYFDPQTVEALTKKSFVVGYHNDDPFGPKSHILRYRLLLPALPYYDGFHVYRPCNLSDAKRHGAKRVALLMPYYLPWMDFPRQLSTMEAAAWGSDVVFAGHVEPDVRTDCLVGAARQGIRVRIFGERTYWRRALPSDVYGLVKPIEFVSGENYRRALCASKIAACFLSKWNRDVYTRRVFEITACGRFLLCERTTEMRDMFKEGYEADYFTSVEEFVDKVSFYLRNARVRQQIELRGQERARKSGHDIHSRMRQWCSDVSSWMADRS